MSVSLETIANRLRAPVRQSTRSAAVDAAAKIQKDSKRKDRKRKASEVEEPVQVKPEKAKSDDVPMDDHSEKSARSLKVLIDTIKGNPKKIARPIRALETSRLREFANLIDQGKVKDADSFDTAQWKQAIEVEIAKRSAAPDADKKKDADEPVKEKADAVAPPRVKRQKTQPETTYTEFVRDRAAKDFAKKHSGNGLPDTDNEKRYKKAFDFGKAIVTAVENARAAAAKRKEHDTDESVKKADAVAPPQVNRQKTDTLNTFVVIKNGLDEDTPSVSADDIRGFQSMMSNYPHPLSLELHLGQADITVLEAWRQCALALSEQGDASAKDCARRYIQAYNVRKYARKEIARLERERKEREDNFWKEPGTPEPQGYGSSSSASTPAKTDDDGLLFKKMTEIHLRPSAVRDYIGKLDSPTLDKWAKWATNSTNSTWVDEIANESRRRSHDDDVDTAFVLSAFRSMMRSHRGDSLKEHLKTLELSELKTLSAAAATLDDEDADRTRYSIYYQREMYRRSQEQGHPAKKQVKQDGPGAGGKESDDPEHVPTAQVAKKTEHPEPKATEPTELAKQPAPKEQEKKDVAPRGVLTAIDAIRQFDGEDTRIRDFLRSLEHEHLLRFGDELPDAIAAHNKQRPSDLVRSAWTIHVQKEMDWRRHDPLSGKTEDWMLFVKSVLCRPMPNDNLACCPTASLSCDKAGSTQNYDKDRLGDEHTRRAEYLTTLTHCELLKVAHKASQESSVFASELAKWKACIVAESGRRQRLYAACCCIREPVIAALVERLAQTPDEINKMSYVQLQDVVAYLTDARDNNTDVLPGSLVAEWTSIIDAAKLELGSRMGDRLTSLQLEEKMRADPNADAVAIQIHALKRISDLYAISIAHDALMQEIVPSVLLGKTDVPATSLIAAYHALTHATQCAMARKSNASNGTSDIERDVRVLEDCADAILTTIEAGIDKTERKTSGQRKQEIKDEVDRQIFCATFRRCEARYIKTKAAEQEKAAKKAKDAKVKVDDMELDDAVGQVRDDPVEPKDKEPEKGKEKVQTEAKVGQSVLSAPQPIDPKVMEMAAAAGPSEPDTTGEYKCPTAHVDVVVDKSKEKTDDKGKEKADVLSGLDAMVKAAERSADTSKTVPDAAGAAGSRILPQPIWRQVQILAAQTQEERAEENTPSTQGEEDQPTATQDDSEL